jgi:GT2 family glycosyltransferase
MKKLPKKNDLSVIILNYNSGNYLAKCLLSLKNSDLKTYQIEFIIPDNASTDNSLDIAKNINLSNSQFIISPNNLGFSAGNNFGLKYITDSRYVLFLNPDTTVEPNTLAGMIQYFDEHPQIDAATCNVILALTGKTQQECHRDFPSPLNAFLHFTGISSRQYFMEYLDYSKVQPINACIGAFLMVKKIVGDTIGWWNEKYFFYGEDLDFCYKLKQNNYQLYFIPQFKITHFQGISSGIKKTKSAASRQTKIRSALASTNAMKIFYQENLLKNYSPLWRFIVWQGINLLEFYRLFKAKYL